MSFLEPEHLIQTFGMIGLFAIVFAESGLLIGFFLPGDSLLFTAGLLASQGKLNLAAIIIGCVVAAIVGDQVGYATGYRAGPRIFRRSDSRLFKREYVDKAQGYFDRYGPKTIVMARFVPIVRTFAPIVAGVGKMHYRTFLTYNIVGGVLWAAGVTLLGAALGEVIPDIDKYLLPAIGVIVLVSVLPVVLEVLRERRKGQAARSR